MCFRTYTILLAAGALFIAGCAAPPSADDANAYCRVTVELRYEPRENDDAERNALLSSAIRGIRTRLTTLCMENATLETDGARKHPRLTITFPARYDVAWVTTNLFAEGGLQIRRVAHKAMGNVVLSRDMSGGIFTNNAIVPENAEVLYTQGKGEEGALPVIVETNVRIDGSMIAKAYPAYNSTFHNYDVAIEMTEEGKETFAALTQENVGRPLAIVIRGIVVMAPTVQEAITEGRVLISAGGYTKEEAEYLALLLMEDLPPLTYRIIRIERGTR